MPYCPLCGVELEETVKSCPLCNTPILITAGKEAAAQGTKQNPGSGPRFALQKNRHLILEVITIINLITLVILVVADLIGDLRLNWIMYPALAQFLVNLLFFLGLYFYRRPVILIPAAVVSVTAFLYLLDYFDTNLNWFTDIALPAVIMLTVVVSIVVTICLQVKRKGANIAAVIILGIGIICYGLEVIISRYSNLFNPSWSAYILVPCIGISLLLFYFHYRVSRVIDIKKYFKF